jgi:hypothetical protein
MAPVSVLTLAVGIAPCVTSDEIANAQQPAIKRTETANVAPALKLVIFGALVRRSASFQLWHAKRRRSFTPSSRGCPDLA